MAGGRLVICIIYCLVSKNNLYFGFMLSILSARYKELADFNLILKISTFLLNCNLKTKETNYSSDLFFLTSTPKLFCRNLNADREEIFYFIFLDNRERRLSLELLLFCKFASSHLFNASHSRKSLLSSPQSTSASFFTCRKPMNQQEVLLLFTCWQPQSPAKIRLVFSRLNQLKGIIDHTDCNSSQNQLFYSGVRRGERGHCCFQHISEIRSGLFNCVQSVGWFEEEKRICIKM